MAVTREIVNLAEITIIANLFLKKDKLISEFVHDFGEYDYKFIFTDCEVSNIDEWAKRLKEKNAEDIYIDFDSNIDICQVASWCPARFDL